MSEALRALNDGMASFDSPEGIDDPETSQAQTSDQTPEPPEPEPSEPEGSEPEPEAEPEQKQQPEKRPRKASAVEWANKEREKRYKVEAQLQAQQQEMVRLRNEIEESRKAAAKAQRQAKIDADPDLKTATSFLEKGYTPEFVEADAARREANAVRLEANGDLAAAEREREFAAQARVYAMHMRNVQAEHQREQQTQAQQQQVTQWRNTKFGTHEFDEAVDKLEPGTQEFDDAWATVEQGWIERMKASQDPWDQECARQFADKNSEFGQRLTYFLTQSDMGRRMAKHPLAIIPAYGISKMSMILDHQAAAIRQKDEEINRLRGFTAPSNGLPVNGEGAVNGASLPDRESNPNDYLKAFERLSKEEMGRLLRARVTE